MYTRENLEIIAKKVISSRGLEIREEQLDLITDPEIYISGTLPIVIGAFMGAGKTEIVLTIIEIVYIISVNSKEKKPISVFMPGWRKDLLDNVAERLNKFCPSFKYLVISQDRKDEGRENYLYLGRYKDKSKLESELKIINPSLLVCLPRTFLSRFDFIKNVNMYIQDEAYAWYFAPTVQEILKRSKPRKQLLPSAPISKFVAKKDEFIIKTIDGDTLYEKKRICDWQIEMIKTTIDIKKSDYTREDDLRPDYSFTSEETLKILNDVIEEMYDHILNPRKTKIGQNIRNVTGISIGGFFKSLEDKTMIACPSIQFASEIYKILISKDELHNKVLISHSDSKQIGYDPGGNKMEKFKEDPEQKILLVVDRGRIGFDVSELFNFIDLTFSLNPDSCLNMMGRIVRPSKKNPSRLKYYFKVAPVESALYSQDVMQLVILLSNKKYYELYNGKNIGSMPIVRIKRDNKKSENTENTKNPDDVLKKSQKSNPLQDLPFSLGPNFFKQCYHRDDHPFITFSFITFAEARKSWINPDKDFERRGEIFVITNKIMEECIENDYSYKYLTEESREQTKKYFPMTSTGGSEEKCNIKNPDYDEKMYEGKYPPFVNFNSFFSAFCNETGVREILYTDCPSEKLEKILREKNITSRPQLIEFSEKEGKKLGIPADGRLVKVYGSKWVKEKFPLNNWRSKITEDELRSIYAKALVYANDPKIQGAKLGELGKPYDLSGSTLREAFESMGLVFSIPSQKETLKYEDVYKMVVEDRLSISEVSKTLSIDRKALDAFMKENNIEKPPIMDDKVFKEKFLGSENYSRVEAAKYFNVSSPTIQAAEKRIEGKLRDIRRNKPVIIDGKEYFNFEEAGKKLDINKGTIRNRILDPKFDNYKYKFKEDYEK